MVTYPEPWRRRVLDVGSAAVAALAVITLLFVLSDPIARGSWRTQMLMTLPIGILAASAAWRSGPYALRAGIFVGAALLAELGFLARVGYTAAPALAGLTAVVGAGLLFGVRGAIGGWAMSIAVLLGGSLAIQRGILPSEFDPAMLDPTSSAFGIRYGLTYATFSAALAIGLTIVVERLLASLRDVHVVNAASQENQARWQSVVDNATDQIVIVDREHRIQFRNRALVGTPESEVIGKAIESLLPESHRADAWNGVERVFETGENMTWDSVVNDPSEGRRWFSARVTPIYREGHIDGATVISTDLTERHLLEEQLRHAQKMDAVGQLAGGVAHDFNNLLTVIVGYAEDLLDRVKDDDGVMQDLTAIQEAAVRGSALTGQLLAFSRQQPTDLHSLSLDETVREMQSMLQRLVGETIEFRIDLAHDLDFALADRSQMEQVLANLVVNARDAMPEGGALRVSTRNLELGHEEGERVGLPPGDYVCLAVADEGTGMSTEVRERIFEPFFTTKEVGRGTGLGLSTAYGIVKDAGGAIRVSTRMGEGSRFEVLLPSTGREQREPEPTREGPGLRAVGVKTLLVVEDEDSVRSLLGRVLRKAGYEVVEARDGIEALRLLTDRDESVDAILSDVRMPRMSGPELAREVRRRNPTITVVFMTGYPAEEEVTDVGVATIAKPFSPAELVGRLAELLP